MSDPMANAGASSRGKGRWNCVDELARRRRCPRGLRGRRRGEGGYTLLELMYSVGLFTIGLLGLTHFQVAAMDSTQRSTNISMATNLTASTLEDLKVKPIDELKGTEAATYDFFGFAVTDGKPYYTVTWTAEPKAGYVNVVVETTWTRTFPYISDYVHRVQMSSWVF